MIDARIVKRLPAAQGGDPFELNVHLRSESPVTVLLGASGAGKTLTLNCLAGFAHPDEGRILVQDQLFFDAAAGVHLAPQKRRCGYIFQDHALFPHMTVRQNLRFAIQSSPPPRPGRLERHRRIQEMLEAFELADLSNRQPHELSGGQKQRASIARALVIQPRLLLLDEPTRGLDARLRASFYQILLSTKAKLKVPMIVVTHALDECFELADTVCVIDRGRLLQTGPKEQVIARPGSVELARLLGIYNLLPAEITHLDPGRKLSRLRLAGQEIEGPYLPATLRGDSGWLCVPRHELKVLPYPPQAGDNQLLLEVASSSVTARGVQLEFANGLVAEVSQSDYEDLRGSRELRVAVPRGAVHFLAR
ncbi:MAG TPA: ATP-binding cassette domain-containing protein [Bryobacteraceae bacterium]|jgi:molybdate transport system ATP-binding protein|nr:ATP-binding cassette domain-containing protein [Bryobacteraceae bacterium]HXR75717.1 ATP-binding cassette domain-containing protein [Bryobacteraceae bacterium]